MHLTLMGNGMDANLALLAASQLALTLGHYLLSDGLIRPGARLRWSMASVGAGFGDGTSRTGLPIRWTAKCRYGG